MFGNFDFSKMGEMLSQIQEQSTKMNEQMAGKSYTAKSGGGLVSVTANGIGDIIDITIDPSLLEDREALQILLIASVNEALKMSEEDRKAGLIQMAGSFGGMGR